MNHFPKKLLLLAICYDVILSMKNQLNPLFFNSRGKCLYYMMRKPKKLSSSFIMLDRNAYVWEFFLLNDLQAQENNLRSICGSHEALISNDIMLEQNAIQHLVLREGILCVSGWRGCVCRYSLGSSSPGDWK